MSEDMGFFYKTMQTLISLDLSPWRKFQLTLSSQHSENSCGDPQHLHDEWERTLVHESAQLSTARPWIHMDTWIHITWRQVHYIKCTRYCLPELAHGECYNAFLHSCFIIHVSGAFIFRHFLNMKSKVFLFFGYMRQWLFLTFLLALCTVCACSWKHQPF